MCRIMTITMTLVSAFSLLATSQPQADGCAAVPRLNGPSISIAEESAIIVWVPAKKVQHFIRRAAFDTKSPDFGFLVPTPTLPKLPLEEVEDGIFHVMDTWMLPKTVEQTRWKNEPFLGMFCCLIGATKAPMAADMAKKDGVRVLHEQKVGGFETAVLEADNTEDLGNWLKKNGYSNDPELQSWLVPYVGAKWKITAFKIMQDPKSGQLATTKAVRMTFATERPFFPYREPEGKKVDKDGLPLKEKERDRRMLRVLFVSGARMEGMLGAKAWHASVKWSDQLTDAQRKQVAADTGVPEADIPDKAWLTTFEDSASPRPGSEEVYFDLAKDQTPIVPPPFIKYNDIWIPIDCTLFVAVVLLIVIVVLARKTRLI